MRAIPKQYIHKDDKDLYDPCRAKEIQYERWIDDLLGRIVDLEDQLEEEKHQRDSDRYDLK